MALSALWPTKERRRRLWMCYTQKQTLSMKYSDTKIKPPVLLLGALQPMLILVRSEVCMDSYQLTTLKRSLLSITVKRNTKTKTLLRCWWRCKIVWPLQKTVWRFPKTFKIETPHDTVIPLLDVVQKGLESGSQRYIYAAMCIAALCTIDNLWKQAACQPTDEWINVAYKHNRL